jgi:hypothetical protein
MRAAAERLNDRVDYFAKQASDEYQAIVAATGIVERVRLVEPAGRASSSLCCTERRKSTATEALVSVLLITGRKFAPPYAPGSRADVRSIVTDEARIHIFIGGPSRTGTFNPRSCAADHRLTTETP